MCSYPDLNKKNCIYLYLVITRIAFNGKLFLNGLKMYQKINLA